MSDNQAEKHGILTPGELLAIDTCPDCGAHATKHNDLGRTITPSVCARTVPGARLAAVEQIIRERVARLLSLADEIEGWEWTAPVGPGNASYANGYENGRRSVSADLRALADAVSPPGETGPSGGS